MQPQQLRQRLSLAGTGDDGVHKAVVQQKFRGLEARRQFFSCRLFDDPGPGKADGRAG